MFFVCSSTNGICAHIERLIQQLDTLKCLKSSFAYMWLEIWGKLHSICIVASLLWVAHLGMRI